MKRLRCSELLSCSRAARGISEVAEGQSVRLTAEGNEAKQSKQYLQLLTWKEIKGGLAAMKGKQSSVYDDPILVKNHK